MDDPYKILGLPPDADDAAIRTRYLELVREHPPERSPERFAEVRRAYDAVKDIETRLKKQLFEVNSGLTIEGIVEEIRCKSPRPRLSLAKLVEMANTR
jgi:curved DNA-binding protein CbpA